MRGLIAGSFLVAIGLFSNVAMAKCGYMSTRDRFSAATEVMLVSVVEAHNGPVPLPYGLQKGTTVPGRLLTLRVIKSWKGPLRPEAVVSGYTQGPRVEDSYLYTEVGTKIIFFSASRSPYEIRACNAADPDRLNQVAEELDAITRKKRTQAHDAGG